MFRAAVLTVVLSLAGAPSMVAWCLSACAPGAAAATQADAGHCDLHPAPPAGDLRLAPGDDGHCGTPHESEASLLPGKLVQKTSVDGVLTAAPLLLVPPSVPALLASATRVPAAASPPGSFLTPLRI